MPLNNKRKLEIWKPVGRRLLVKQDAPRKETKGGIVLPDNVDIPQLSGIVVKLSEELETGDDSFKCPIKELDKILYHPKNAVPVDLENTEAGFYIIDADSVLAVKQTNDD